MKISVILSDKAAQDKLTLKVPNPTFFLISFQKQKLDILECQLLFFVSKQ